MAAAAAAAVEERVEEIGVKEGIKRVSCRWRILVAEKKRNKKSRAWRR